MEAPNRPPKRPAASTYAGLGAHEVPRNVHGRKSLPKSCAFLGDSILMLL